MNERPPSSVRDPQLTNAKMAETDTIGPKKTMLVVVVVVGCFAVLWPKVFYPMLVGSASQQLKPNEQDKGCCNVISETDVNMIKIMSELCKNIIDTDSEKPLSGKEVVSLCRSAVLDKCGIDISAVLQEHVWLGHSFKHILDEVRSLNGSLCLKYNFGISPWRLGVPRQIVVNFAGPNVRQERPAHRAEMLHPALREKGRAIPEAEPALHKRGPGAKVVEGRPGPVPGVRPPMGGGSHVVGAPQKGSSVSVIMPFYTIGIVIFFTYTLMKLLFKKKPDTTGAGLYPPVQPDPVFRKEVFESEKSRLGMRQHGRENGSKLVVNAMTALLDEVDKELESRHNEVSSQNEPTLNGTIANGSVSNGNAVKVKEVDHEQPSVKIVGMETTASCEGGQKWRRSASPVIPMPAPIIVPTEPPQSIYLEGALPAQSQLLVTESAIETQTNEEGSPNDPAVVLAGKMTLSVISLDSLAEDTSNLVKDLGDALEKEIKIAETEDEIQIQESQQKIEDQIVQEIEKVSSLEAVPVPEEVQKIAKMAETVLEVPAASRSISQVENEQASEGQFGKEDSDQQNNEDEIQESQINIDLKEVHKEQQKVENQIVQEIEKVSSLEVNPILEEIQKIVEEAQAASTSISQVKNEQYQFDEEDSDEQNNDIAKNIDSILEVKPEQIVSDVPKEEVKKSGDQETEEIEEVQRDSEIEDFDSEGSQENLNGERIEEIILGQEYEDEYSEEDDVEIHEIIIVEDDDDFIEELEGDDRITEILEADGPDSLRYHRTTMNGDSKTEDEVVEDSKYTTASNATHAEQDISEEEGTDEEEVEIDEEDIRENDLNSFKDKQLDNDLETHEL